MFDINIGCNRKGGYYYYIENADDIEKGRIRNWLLNTFAVNNLINESYHLKRRILFEEIPSGRQYLTPIIEAMRDGSEIELLHQSYWYDEPNVYTLQPYCVKVFKQRWYVVGFCKERKALRTFSLDRIHRLTILDTRFVYPKNFDPATYFADSFGIFVEGEDVEPVRLKVYGMHCQYVRALPLHHSQQEVERNQDFSVFEYKMKPSFDFKQELLSRGADVEVLQPLWLREEMGEAIGQMTLRYENDASSK